MIRKLILSAVLASGAVAATAATADAAPPAGYDHDRHGVRFEVLVRHHGHWNTYGTYHDRGEAERVARMLEHRGEDARVEVEHGRW